MRSLPAPPAPLIPAKAGTQAFFVPARSAVLSNHGTHGTHGTGEGRTHGFHGLHGWPFKLRRRREHSFAVDEIARCAREALSVKSVKSVVPLFREFRVFRGSGPLTPAL